MPKFRGMFSSGRLGREAEKGNTVPRSLPRGTVFTVMGFGTAVVMVDG